MSPMTTAVRIVVIVGPYHPVVKGGADLVPQGKCQRLSNNPTGRRLRLRRPYRDPPGFSSTPEKSPEPVVVEGTVGRAGAIHGYVTPPAVAG